MKYLGLIFLALFLITPAKAAEPIKIGDSFAYSDFAAFAQPYKNGWKLAVEQKNAKGGILGRMIEVISVDHGADPAQALRAVEGLVERDRVDVLAGTVLGSVTNAIGSYANNKEIPIVTIWNTMPASGGVQHDYMFSIMSTEPHAYASAELAASLPITRWATIAPNYAWGQTNVELFKKRLKALRPDVEFVAAQWPTVQKINASTELLALRKAEPEGVFSAMFGTDLAAFVREGNRQQFFEDKVVIGTEAAQRIHLDLIGKDLKGTWYGTGYPSQSIDTQEHKEFYDAYVAAYNKPPELYALAAYVIYQFIFQAIEAAGTTDHKAVQQALSGLNTTSPLGNIEMFAHNHRSSLGVWIGRIDNSSDNVEMVDWTYKDAGRYIGTQER